MGPRAAAGKGAAAAGLTQLKPRRLERRRGLRQRRPTKRRRGMKHYRVNKVTEPDGEVLKRKDILANDHRQAIKRAENDPDCPTCDVYHAGEKIGSVT
jgi:hypothetical protein